MAFTLTASASEPLGELNTTPLIDVMLVLLVMMILSIPIATHSVPIDLPSSNHTTLPPIDPVFNTVSITPDSTVTFNNRPVTIAELAATLKATLALRPEPELRYQPAPAAPYDTAAKVLGVIKASGISAFGMVGNEQFQSFGKQPAQGAARVVQ